MSQSKLLHPVPEGPLHLSHFMHLVSAYEPTAEQVAILWDDLRTAQQEAKANHRSVVVDQDSGGFAFIVHPSGRISLAAMLATYEMKEPEKIDPKI